MTALAGLGSKVCQGLGDVDRARSDRRRGRCASGGLRGRGGRIRCLGEGERQAAFFGVEQLQLRLDQYDARRGHAQRPHGLVAQPHRGERSDSHGCAVAVGEADIAQPELQAAFVGQPDHRVLDHCGETRHLGGDSAGNRLGEQLERDGAVEEADVEQASGDDGQQANGYQNARNDQHGSPSRAEVAPGGAGRGGVFAGLAATYEA